MRQTLPPTFLLEHSPVEHFHRSFGVDFARKDDGSKPSRSTVGPEGNISAQDRSRLPEQVLQILPLTVEWKLGKGLTRVGVQR